MRRVLLFLNPILIHNARRRATVEQIAALLARDGREVRLQETLSAHSAGQQARDAVREGFDTFLVCGGDGTIFQVLQGLAGADVTLGVLPFGTGNVIAQNLGMPRDPLAAARMLLTAQAKTVTLGRIEVSPVGHRRMRSWYFLIAAGLGVHAALMNLAPTGMGKRRGGRLAYFLGGFRLLLDHPVQPFRMEITLPDGRLISEIACEAIAVHMPEINLWRPGGDPFGTELQVAWVPPTRRLGLAHASFHALVTGRANGQGWGRLPFPRMIRVRRMVCQPLDGQEYRQPLLVEADGEVLGASSAAIGMTGERLKLLWPERRS